MLNKKSLGFILLILGCVLIWFGLGQFKYKKTTKLQAKSLENQPNESSNPPISSQKINKTTQNKTLEVYGTVESSQVSDIITEINSSITDIRVQEGDLVKKGQILMTLDPRDTQSTFNAALANFNKAKMEFNTQKELLDKSLISKMEFEQAQVSFENAKAAFKTATVRFNSAIIKAPKTTFVQKIYVRNGDTVFAGQTKLITLAAADKFFVRSPVPNQVAGLIKIGSLVKIDGGKIKGKVVASDYTISDGLDTNNIKVSIQESHKLIHGQTILTEFDLGKTEGFKIPSTSLIYDDESGQVGIKIINDSVVGFVPVNLIDNDGENSFITIQKQPEYINLVILGQHYIKNGQEVAYKQL